MGYCEMVVQGQCVNLLICFGVQAFLDLQLRFVDICEATLLRSSRLLGCGVMRPGLYMTGAAVPVLLFGNPGGRLCMEDRYIDTTKSNRALASSITNVNFGVCPELEINPISRTITFGHRPQASHGLSERSTKQKTDSEGLEQFSGLSSLRRRNPRKRTTHECQAATKQTAKNDGDGPVRTPQLVRIVIRVQATSQQYHCWFVRLFARQDFNQEKVCYDGVHWVERSG